MTRSVRSLTASLVLALGFAAVPALAENPARPESRAALDAEWSTRLLLEKARIERSRRRLDEANAAYGKAIATRASDDAVARSEAKRDAAAKELEDAQQSLPALVADALAAGVSPEILKPYRFAVPPAAAP